MHEKLFAILDHFEKIEQQLCEPEVINDRSLYTRITRERAELEELVPVAREIQSVLEEIEEYESTREEGDPDLKDLAAQELPGLRRRLEELEDRARLLLLPRDPNDSKNVILEVRAGTGGEEAALFAADLFRMYARFAESKGWKIEIMSSSETDGGGYKEIIASIAGSEVFSHLKYESGVHRVQRVPATESQGRIHTSAVTVAVMPEAEAVELDIDEDRELRIDVMRASGPGGQCVNTTDSAVRITHVPSGLVVVCQDEKSQHKNRAKALKILRARLLDKMRAEQNAERAAVRRSQVGSGDRSERIRTYNFPQGRITDHRVGLSVHRLDAMLAGDVGQFIEEIRAHFQAEQLRAQQDA